MDSKAILQGLKKAGEIEALRTHDLRRTFATVAEEVASYAVVKRLFKHGNSRDVTGRYTKVDDARLLEEMTRVERVMLGAAPLLLAALT
ncbi:tyrosine-type recombinase/integrase [Stenotrophomonas rhizophila]|uniref:tyrosine-type recombinase/integrase n=1 Tax=Stenotrophomonas rhizophila TaxID=216778 RepID=UPI0016043446|nr:tyrosine-type recombinase/integrase [Stenotrophomonas rhizophila]